MRRREGSYFIKLFNQPCGYKQKKKKMKNKKKLSYLLLTIYRLYFIIHKTKTRRNTYNCQAAPIYSKK